MKCIILLLTVFLCSCGDNDISTGLNNQASNPQVNGGHVYVVVNGQTIHSPDCPND